MAAESEPALAKTSSTKRPKKDLDSETSTRESKSSKTKKGAKTKGQSRKRKTKASKASEQDKLASDSEKEESESESDSGGSESSLSADSEEAVSGLREMKMEKRKEKAAGRDTKTVIRSSSRVKAVRAVPNRVSMLFTERDEGAAELPASMLKFGGRSLRLLCAHPPVYAMDDFLTDKECDHLLAIADRDKKQFKHSFTEDENMKKVVSSERTSMYTWLDKCADATVRTVETRAAEIVGFACENVEPLQIVSYTKGQQFKLHHDMGTLNDDGTVDPLPPRRIVTFFVYLNDMPQGIGHTEFPATEPKLSVRPKRKMAVIWCNVDTKHPEIADARLVHKACPVPEGYFKYGVNIWITDRSCFTL